MYTPSCNLSSSSAQQPTSPSTEDSHKDNAATSTLLYQRHPSRAMFPRILLSLTTIHTGYWTWYVCDFTPAIQSVAAAPIDNTTVGYIGLGLAVSMSAGSFIYPKSLIQEIRLKEPSSTNSTLEIKTYSLPFVTPSKTTIEYKSGNIIIDSPNDVKSIIEDYDGDISQYDGYLPLHAEGRKINLLLQLSDANEKDESKLEVVNSKTLFQSLLAPELRSVLDSSSQDYSSSGSNSSSSENEKDRQERNEALKAKKEKQKKRKLMRRK